MNQFHVYSTSMQIYIAGRDLVLDSENEQILLSPRPALQSTHDELFGSSGCLLRCQCVGPGSDRCYLPACTRVRQLHQR
jgi:hypothetical protein